MPIKDKNAKIKNAKIKNAVIKNASMIKMIIDIINHYNDTFYKHRKLTVENCDILLNILDVIFYSLDTYSRSNNLNNEIIILEEAVNNIILLNNMEYINNLRSVLIQYYMIFSSWNKKSIKNLIEDFNLIKF